MNCTMTIDKSFIIIHSSTTTIITTLTINIITIPPPLQSINLETQLFNLSLILTNLLLMYYFYLIYSSFL